MVCSLHYHTKVAGNCTILFLVICALPVPVAGSAKPYQPQNRRDVPCTNWKCKHMWPLACKKQQPSIDNWTIDSQELMKGKEWAVQYNSFQPLSQEFIFQWVCWVYWHHQEPTTYTGHNSVTAFIPASPGIAGSSMHISNMRVTQVPLHWSWNSSLSSAEMLPSESGIGRWVNTSWRRVNTWRYTSISFFFGFGLQWLGNRGSEVEIRK